MFPGVPVLVVATEAGLWKTSPETFGLTTMGVMVVGLCGNEIKGIIDDKFANKSKIANIIYTGSKGVIMFAFLAVLFTILTQVSQSAAIMFGYMSASKAGGTMLKAYGEKKEEL